MTQSEELGLFYQAIWDWIGSNYQNNPHGFDKVRGLCSSLGYYVISIDGAPEDIHELREEMKSQFIDAQLDVQYPFDSHSSDYALTSNKFINPKRLAWIKDHLPNQGENHAAI